MLHAASIVACPRSKRKEETEKNHLPARTRNCLVSYEALDAVNAWTPSNQRLNGSMKRGWGEKVEKNGREESKVLKYGRDAFFICLRESLRKVFKWQTLVY